MQVIKAWMEHEGGDHVLRQNDKYLICDTIKDIEWEEVVYTDEASMQKNWDIIEYSWVWALG